jgi:type I restriction enzyme R subunit
MTEEGREYDPEEPTQKVVIKLADGKARSIQFIATTTYWGPDGRPMSAQQFLERLFGDLAGLIIDEDALRAEWSDPDRRERLVAVLADRGYDADKLDDMRQLIDAPNSDLFDVLAYIRFTSPPKTRHERAEAAERDGLVATVGEMRGFLVGVLQAYAAHGESELSLAKLSSFLTARYGTLADAKARLGGTGAIKAAFVDIQRELYAI